MEKILTVPIEEEMQQSYLDYAMSVIVGRALPDVRDGLKPVHRRILYTMYQEGVLPDKPYKKSARIVGSTLGKYHPHGDSAVYEALVRMAQDFSLRYRLVDGQGNFGSIDGDSPAAQRYTEARLSKIALELLKDIEKETVDFRPNYDESLLEPEVLPARFPNLLVNGSAGIAVGMATNIPPHNLFEVCSAVKFLLDNEDADIEQIMQYIKAPDFPTGAEIINPQDLKGIYSTGRGSVVIRAKHHIEEIGRKTAIVVTEIPYQVNKAELIKKIASLVKDKKIEGISDIRDESDREGIRVVIELKRDATAQVVLNKLYKLTPLQTSFGVNFIALVSGEPKLLNLKEYLLEFIKFRKEVILRKSAYLLKKAKDRLHIVEGLLVALKEPDKVISIIKDSKDAASASEKLSKELGLSPAQSKAILDMKLQRLTALEKGKLASEESELKEKIAELQKILESESELKKLIKADMDYMINHFADDRKTKVVFKNAEIDLEQMIEDEEVVIFLTKKGFVKRVSAKNYRAQGRSGTGVKGIKTREDDFVKDIITANSKAYLLVFTNAGRVYWLKAYEIPKSERTSRGHSIRNFLAMSGAEEVSKIIPVRSFKDGVDILFVTRNGFVKRTPLSEFSNPRQTGINAINLEEGDRLVFVGSVLEGDEVMLITKSGRAIKFPSADIRRMGRSARGVKGITLEKGDGVAAAAVVKKDDRFLLVITENGYGKRTQISEFPLQRRGGKGVYAIKLSSKTGRVADAITLKDDEDIIVVSEKGKLIRLSSSEISIYSRLTRGVRIQRLSDDDDRVVSVAKVVEDEGI